MPNFNFTNQKIEKQYNVNVKNRLSCTAKNSYDFFGSVDTDKFGVNDIEIFN